MTLKLNGSSSGSVSIDAPASTAGGADRTLTLPDDASNGVVKTSTYPSSIQVLEQFQSVCDGSVIATAQGNVTMPTITSSTALTTSYIDLPGSAITYTPPTGTTQVIYKFIWNHARIDDHAIASYRFYVGGTEVTDARYTWGSVYTEGQIQFEWSINIGGTGVAATGRQASWTSGKELKMTTREYNSDHETQVHTSYLFDGASSAQFHRPQIGITAIGAG